MYVASIRLVFVMLANAKEMGYCNNTSFQEKTLKGTSNDCNSYSLYLFKIHNYCA